MSVVIFNLCNQHRDEDDDDIDLDSEDKESEAEVESKPLNDESKDLHKSNSRGRL